MQRIALAYGRTGLDLDLDVAADVIEPRYLPGLPDEAAAIRDALRAPRFGTPLRELVPRGAHVGISVCDVTRPFPSRRILPIIVDELSAVGAGQVTVFIATGTHRPCTPDELQQMLGDDVLTRCEIVQHDAFDRARHRQVGSVLGTTTPAL